MELHALQRQRLVAHTHDHVGAVIRGAVRRRDQAVGQVESRERVVAHRRESLRQTREDAPAVVGDVGDLPMREPVQVLHHAAAVRRHQPLHAQADAEHRHRAREEYLASDREVLRFVRAAGSG